MKSFELYADDNYPDLLTSHSPSARFTLIGCIGLTADIRRSVVDDIKTLRDNYQLRSEFKWHKVNRALFPFYSALVDFFIEQPLNFRCLVVDTRTTDLSRLKSDCESIFYCLYCHALRLWLPDIPHSTNLQIRCDMKNPLSRLHFKTVRSCLNKALAAKPTIDEEGKLSPSGTVGVLQVIPSQQSQLIQLCDLLLGATSARLNSTLSPSSPKEQLVQHLESKLGSPIVCSGSVGGKFSVAMFQPEATSL